MQIRVAPSLGEGFAGKPCDTWGGVPYLGDIFHDSRPCLFFGVYGLPDFFSLWRHRGKKYILWAGSDIRHFINGYWLDTKGEIRFDPEPLAEWISKNCESYVENGVEAEALRVFGIESKIVPSFLGNLEDYQVEYRHNSRPMVYLSVSGDDFSLYRWDLIEEIADKCGVDFHLYGNTKEWTSKHSNVFVHGRIPQEQMNEEIKHMQCGLRVLEFDGFSEILAKSVLWGQYPISYIGYPHIDSFKSNGELVEKLNNLVNMQTPNLKARDYYLNNLNNYPWNTKL